MPGTITHSPTAHEARNRGRGFVVETPRGYAAYRAGVELQREANGGGPQAQRVVARLIVKHRRRVRARRTAIFVAERGSDLDGPLVELQVTVAGESETAHLRRRETDVASGHSLRQLELESRRHEKLEAGLVAVDVPSVLDRDVDRDADRLAGGNVTGRQRRLRADRLRGGKRRSGEEQREDER
jgi:hypothetical protein